MNTALAFPQHFLIEPCSDEHGAAMRELIISIQRDEFGIPISLGDQPDLFDVSTFYRQGNGQFWIARDGERVIGTIALVDIGNGEVALRKMFVHPDYRGREKGVGASLLAEAIAHCRERGVKYIFLGTTAKYFAAHRFYEKNGFEEISATELPTAFPRMEVDTKFYRLDLHSQ